MCACHNKKALDWHTCVPVNKECTSQQLIFLSLLTTQAHTNSGKGRQWHKQINMVSLLLEDYYYCLKTRLGLVGGLAIAFFPLSILLILCQPLATTDLMLQQPKKNDKSLTPTTKKSKFTDAILSEWQYLH